MADTLTTTEYRLTTENQLKSLVRRTLEQVGVSAENASTVADVLIAADLRGIE